MTALLYSFGVGTRTLFVCFLSVSIFHITQCFLEKYPVNKILADISKVMLMPLLLSIFLSCLGCVLSPSLLSKLIISALVFSTAGDTALLFDSKKIFFLLGMIFFAFAQISYILFSAFILLEGSVPFGKTLVAGILFIRIFAHSYCFRQFKMDGFRLRHSTLHDEFSFYRLGAYISFHGNDAFGGRKRHLHYIRFYGRLQAICRPNPFGAQLRDADLYFSPNADYFRRYIFNYAGQLRLTPFIYFCFRYVSQGLTLRTNISITGGCPLYEE